jgi:hypothetical protein
VEYNINFAAAIKVSKPDNSGKAAGFPGSQKDMSYSFKDSLKEAVRSNSRNELKADDRNVLRRELVARSEVKLKNTKTSDVRPKENKKTIDENEEKQKDKADLIAEQLLTKLEELAGLQQTGEIPAEKHAELLESIETALKELETVQSKSMVPEAAGMQAKLAEITTLLEAHLTKLKTSESLNAGNNTEGIAAELKTDDSMLAGKNIEDFVSELKAILSKEPQKSETPLITKTDINPDNVSIKQEAKIPEAKETTDTGVKEMAEAETTAQKPEKNKDLQAEGKLTSEEVSVNKNHEAKVETPVVEANTPNKEAKPAAEENVEDVKAAVDSKVEKANV